MEIGDIVQVWSETEHKCLGWGKIVATAFREPNNEEIPLIHLEKGFGKIWGDECYWIDRKKAIEIGLNIYCDVFGK